VEIKKSSWQLAVMAVGNWRPKEAVWFGKGLFVKGTGRPSPCNVVDNTINRSLKEDVKADSMSRLLKISLGCTQAPSIR
jgi:hypothetical protein